MKGATQNMRTLKGAITSLVLAHLIIFSGCGKSGGSKQLEIGFDHLQISEVSEAALLGIIRRDSDGSINVLEKTSIELLEDLELRSDLTNEPGTEVVLLTFDSRLIGFTPLFLEPNDAGEEHLQILPTAIYHAPLSSAKNLQPLESSDANASLIERFSEMVFLVEEAGVIEDLDGDGFISLLDCKDDDSVIHPATAELCGDTEDNNCDGTVDEYCQARVYEAEDFATLSGYEADNHVEPNGFAFDGIRVSDGVSIGSAEQTFTDGKGTYDIALTYVLTSADPAELDVFFTDYFSRSFTLETGSPTDWQYRTRTYTNISMDPGDRILFEGFSTSSDRVLIDKVTFTPSMGSISPGP